MIQLLFCILIVFFVFAFFAARQSRRKCIFAFGQGVADAGKLSWAEIRKKFDSYLKPMKSVDAAAYQRGLEYSLTAASNSNLESMKKCFLDAYSSGTITLEGSVIKKLGAEAAYSSFKLRIPQELELKILSNPEVPPLVSIKQIKDEESE
jgi:hypothetical protein